MLVCKECGRIYEGLFGLRKCPSISCGGELINIDKNLINVCQKLWGKGYETKFSCESHFTENDVCSPYLVFMIPINDTLTESIPNIKEFVGYRYEYNPQAYDEPVYYKYEVKHITESSMSEVEKELVTKEEADKLSVLTDRLINYLGIEDFWDDFSVFYIWGAEDGLQVSCYATPPMFEDGFFSRVLCDDDLDDYEKFLDNKKEALDLFYKLADRIVPATKVPGIMFGRSIIPKAEAFPLNYPLNYKESED